MIRKSETLQSQTATGKASKKVCKKSPHGLIGGKCLSTLTNAIFFNWEQEIKKYEYEMGGVKLESVHSVKDLGVTITSNLKFSQHCKEAVCKANKMLGFININFFLYE